MFIRKQRLMAEMDGLGSQDGMGVDGVSGDDAEAGAEGGDEIQPYLRDLSEDDVYGRLQEVKDFPNRMRTMESRIFGSMGPLNERLQKLEQSLGTRASVNTDALKPLEGYDKALYEQLMQVLPQAVQVQSLDEAALQPFLAPLQKRMMQEFREMLAQAFYDPDDVDGMIPVTKDGVFDPQNDRQKAFADWYSRQDFNTQQSLNELGPGWVRALRRFEAWEKEQEAKKQQKAAAGETRLAGGARPNTAGRRKMATGPQTAEEAFTAGFDEVMKSLSR